MGIQRFERRPLGQHHVQRTQLLPGLLDTECRQQLGIAGAGAEHHALGADLAPVDPQAGELRAITQRLDVPGGQQSVTRQLGQPGDQAGHIQHQFGQAIDLALELAVLQRRRQLLALDLVDAAAHGLAGEETGEVAGQGAGRPQVMGFGEQAHAGEVQLAAAAEGFTPAPGHIGNGFRCTGQGAVQRVFGTAVDDALGLHALFAAKAAALDQQGAVAQAPQARVQPQAGDTAADDQDISAQGLRHAGAHDRNRRAV